MPERSPLPDQEARARAVTTVGRDVLVAASAGTGKTTVLTERVVQAVAARGRDVTRILVLTFTDAAAEEMRHRIAEQLGAISRNRADPRLRAQVRRLVAAPISTIHAFCKRSLEAQAFRAGLDPTRRLLDEDEAGLLRRAALRRAAAEAWADPAATEGLALLFAGRGPEAVLDDVERVCRLLEGLPDPAAWLTQTRRQLEVAGPIAPELRARWLRTQVDAIAGQLDLAARLDARLCEGAYLAAPLAAAVLHVEACRKALDAGDLDTCAATLQDWTWPRLPGGRKPWPTEVRKPVKDAYDRVKRTVESLAASALVAPGFAAVHGSAEAHQGLALLDLVTRRRAAYARAKAEEGGLDFSDLEHGLLDLLRRCPDAAAGLRAQFDEILVDEYQDVNAVQQALLDHLRRPGAFFAVGDVKQAIYSFRLARPTIFLDALREAAARPERTERLDLQTNFRCRPAILDFVNAVCAGLLHADMAGLDYDERARLLAGRPGGTPACPVELALLGSPSGGGGAAALTMVSDSQRQAAWVAARIQELVGGGTEITDRATGRPRALTYGDIAVLLRSPRSCERDYAEILRLAGIPVSGGSTDGYFTSPEVQDLLSLLRVLDNPHQDVDLAAVLRSQMLGLSDADLAEIALVGRERQGREDFHTTVNAARREAADPGLRQRIGTALESLDRWRRLARNGRLADLLWRVYRETGFLSFVSVLPDGAQRRANLLKLHDRALQFQAGSGDVSLGGFVAFIESLLGEQRDWGAAEPEDANGNAVRILSIHKSKGLEFPVVILAELQRSFNLQDARGRCLADEGGGLGLAVADPEAGRAVHSPTHEALALFRRHADLAEELRVLYVALTRARERLILCGAIDPDALAQRRELRDLLAGAPIPAVLLRRSPNALDWLLYARPEGVTCVEVPGDEIQARTQTLLARQRELAGARRALLERPRPRPDATLTPLVERLTRPYPHARAVTQPAKRSVSELTHEDDAFAALDTTRALKRIPELAARRRSGRGDPRQRGTVWHLVLETLPLEPGSPPTVAQIQAHVAALVEAGRIDAPGAADIDTDAIGAFLNGPTGRLCLAPDARLQREWPFTLAVPETDTDADDFTVVQGIVDLLIERPDGITLVDYKTDCLTEDELPERAATYRGQIALYARAVAAIRRRPVRAAVLYFTALRREVGIDLEQGGAEGSRAGSPPQPGD